MENYKFTKRVYYVRSQEDDTVILAIDPKIKDGYLVWFDTRKERMKLIDKVIMTKDDEFSFISGDNKIYSFLPITIDLYEKYIKSHLLAPKPYKDEDELINQIVETMEFAW